MTARTGRTRLAAYALCLDGRRLLLARVSPSNDTDAAKWTLPGGRVEWGEHPNDAVVRELREETGLEGSIVGLAGVFSHAFIRCVDPVHVVGIIYHIEASADAALCYEVGGTTDFCSWVPLSEVGELPLVPLVEFALRLTEERDYAR